MSGEFPTGGWGDLANVPRLDCAKLPETAQADAGADAGNVEWKEVPVVRYTDTSQAAVPVDADMLLERLNRIAPILAAFATLMAVMFGTIYFAVDMALGGMDSLRDEVRHLSAVVYEMREDIAELKADVAVLKADVAVLKADVAVLKVDVAVLKADVAVLKADVATLKVDVATLKADVAEIRVELARNRADIDALHQRVDKPETAATAGE